VQTYARRLYPRVKPGVAGFLHQADRSCKKTSVRRALAVVETIIGLVRFRIGDGGQRCIITEQSGLIGNRSRT
jgi:hypothetical protein